MNVRCSEIPKEICDYIEKNQKKNPNCQTETICLYVKARKDELLNIDDFSKYVFLQRKRGKGYIESDKIKELLYFYLSDKKLVESNILKNVLDCFYNNGSQEMFDEKTIQEKLTLFYSSKRISFYQKVIAIYFVVILISQIKPAKEQFRDFFHFLDNVAMSNYRMCFTEISSFEKKEIKNCNIYYKMLAVASYVLDYLLDDELGDSKAVNYLRKDSDKFSSVLVAIYYLGYFINIEKTISDGINGEGRITDEVLKNTKPIHFENLDTLFYMLSALYKGGYESKDKTICMRQQINEWYKKLIVLRSK